MISSKTILMGSFEILVSTVIMVIIVWTLVKYVPFFASLRETKKEIKDWIRAPSITNIPVLVFVMIFGVAFSMYRMPKITLPRITIEIIKEVIMWWAALSVI